MLRANMLKYEEMARDMISLLPLSEKVSQLRHHSKTLPKANIPSYNWWNECLHGVARAGLATVFPQAIALGATFSDDIVYKVADIISTEARAKHHEAIRKGERGIYQGLDFWSPNINIFRDPRWGRGQETYGECPTLTAMLGMAFVRGLQGDNDEYYKTSAAVKHFAVHSGPEAERHSMDIEVSPKDLNETYLYAFKRAVVDAKVSGVMTAYNMVNGESCAASSTLLGDILRKKWDFKGYVVSDCGGLYDILFKHHQTINPLKAVAMAINSGLDLECGTFYHLLPMAVRLGYVDESAVDTALTRLLSLRIALGMFDDKCPYNSIPYSENATPSHEEYAIDVARKSIVLLKNNGILPLDNKKIGLTGYNATNEIAYLGNYYGTPSKFITLKDALPDAVYTLGYDPHSRTDYVSDALSDLRDVDTVVVATGLDSTMEGEAGDAGAGKDGIIGKQGDRESIALPSRQIALINALHESGKHIIICNFSGSAVSFVDIEDKVDAILEVWYPGAMGGAAISDILYGKVSPSGRLPVTFYRSADDLPPFEDYSMTNRTYRYYTGEVEYPFGYGLSFATFEYANLTMENNVVGVDITNTGDMDADEVAEVYVEYLDDDTMPHIKLVAFQRYHIKAGETTRASITIDRENLLGYDENGNEIVVDGRYRIFVGGGQPKYSPTVDIIQDNTFLL